LSLNTLRQLVAGIIKVRPLTRQKHIAIMFYREKNRVIASDTP